MLKVISESLLATFSLFNKGKLWVYFIPTASVVFFFYIASGGFDSLVESNSTTDESWWDWIVNHLFYSWDWLMEALMYFTLFALMSPLYGIVSGVVFRDLTGEKSHFSSKQLFFEIVRMIVLFIIFELLRAIIVLPLTLLFWSEDSLFTQLLFFIIQAAFIGFAFLDYSMEIDGVSISDSIEFFFKYLFYCIVLGCIFQFITFLSYPGLIIAPIFTAVLATVLYLNIKKIKA